jgi:excisionase family DNA binding protein
MSDVSLLLTTGDVAARLGISRSTVIRLCDLGQLPYLKVGAGDVKPRYRIRPADLESFMASRYSGPQAPV